MSDIDALIAATPKTVIKKIRALDAVGICHGQIAQVTGRRVDLIRQVTERTVYAPGTETLSVSFRITPEEMDAVRVAAKARKRSIPAFVGDLVRANLAKRMGL